MKSHSLFINLITTKITIQMHISRKRKDMGFKEERDFCHIGWYLHCKQAKYFVNVIQHGDGDVSFRPPTWVSEFQSPLYSLRTIWVSEIQTPVYILLRAIRVSEFRTPLYSIASYMGIWISVTVILDLGVWSSDTLIIILLRAIPCSLQ
jgi:hypothetical protein